MTERAPSLHLSTYVDRPADEVYAYVVDPSHLPEWAAGLTPEVEVRFAPANPYGVADHDVTLPDGTVLTVPLRVLADGDLLSVDFAASVDGWVSDSALSVVVGTAAQQDLDLIDTASRALDAGIAAAQAGSRIGDISAAISAVAHADGLSVNTDFGGHGVGRTMHGDPHVPNDGRPGRGYPLKPGLVIAIEPWFLQTTDVLWTDPDGWTLRSGDGSRGAHMEHTIAITEDGPLVLTAR